MGARGRRPLATFEETDVVGDGRAAKEWGMGGRVAWY